MRVAILAFDGFNELDVFIALGLINRLAAQGVVAEIAAPATHVTSMNGVTVAAQRPLGFAREADAVLFSSGLYSRAIAEYNPLLDTLALDPTRQLIGAQCSGTLLMARLGLLGDCPACTDAVTKPFLVEAGVRVVDQAFMARGPVATAGGSMSAIYLATWLMWHATDRDSTRQALCYVAPVGEKEEWAERALKVVGEVMKA